MPTSDSLIDGPETPPPSTPAAAKPAASAPAESTSLVLGATYLFYVKIDGVTVALFSECNGIGAKRGVEPIREGGLNDYVHLLAKPIEHEHITLKRGLSTSRALWDWFDTGKYALDVARHTITIEQVAVGAEAAGRGLIKTWEVLRAFPVSWKLSDLNSGSSTLAFETLELAHEGVSLK